MFCDPIIEEMENQGEDQQTQQGPSNGNSHMSRSMIEYMHLQMIGMGTCIVLSNEPIVKKKKNSLCTTSPAISWNGEWESLYSHHGFWRGLSYISWGKYIHEAMGFHEANVIYDNPIYMEQCSSCQSIEHEVSDCPTIPAMWKRLVRIIQTCHGIVVKSNFLQAITHKSNNSWKTLHKKFFWLSKLL